MTDIELMWHDTPAVSPELEAQVTTELRGELKTMPEGFRFGLHYVALGGDNDPCVKVWQDEGDHRFHCTYLDQYDGPMVSIDDIPGLREKLIAAGWDGES